MTPSLQAGARRCLAWGVGLVFCLTSPHAAADIWTFASSDHFEVYTTAGDRRAREALTYFESVHAFFVDYLKLSPTLRAPTRLIIFANDKQYAPYRPNEVATAYYQPGPDRDYIVMRSLDANSYPLVVHEYAHLIVEHSKSEFPVWLNEGLAEFFSTMAPEGRKMSLGKVPLGRLQYLVNEGRLLPLARLLSVDHDSPEYNTKAHAGTFYSQSWATTHMIMADPRYAGRSSQVLQRIGAGQLSAAVLTSVYGKTLDAIGRDVQDYIHRDRYHYFLADYRAPKAEAARPTRAASDFEAGLAIANLLAVTRVSEEEARAAFVALAARQPDRLELVESQASFEWRRGHLEAARPFLVRAIALGSRNVGLHIDYAILVSLEDPDLAESLFTKAVLLDPDDLESRLRCAEFLGRRRKYRDALQTLAPVTRVPAEQSFRLFQLLVNANAALGRLDEALVAADRLLSAAKPGAEAERAAQLKRDLSARIEQRTVAPATSSEPPPREPSVSREVLAPSAGPLPPSRVSTPFSVTPGVTRFAVGAIRNMVCGGKVPILDVRTVDGATLRLVIDDPLAIKVEGTGTVTTDLQCGAQNRRVTVGYDPAADSVLRTVGKVRLLRFAQQ